MYNYIRRIKITFGGIFMLKNFDIKPPFFEVGPKAIIWGDAMLKLAKLP